MKEGECEDDRAADGVEPGVHWVQHVVEGRAGEKKALDAIHLVSSNKFLVFVLWTLNPVHNGVHWVQHIIQGRSDFVLFTVA